MTSMDFIEDYSHTLQRLTTHNSFYNNDQFVELGDKTVFVFGSNLAGRHGRGIARQALDNFGAIYGQPNGLQGDSYAIPIKDRRGCPLEPAVSNIFVAQFVEFTKKHPDLTFFVTQIGKEINKNHEEALAEMFRDAERCWFPCDWEPYIRW